jgi:hypothetical protein
MAEQKGHRVCKNIFVIPSQSQVKRWRYTWAWEPDPRSQESLKGHKAQQLKFKDAKLGAENWGDDRKRVGAK